MTRRLFPYRSVAAGSLLAAMAFAAGIAPSAVASTAGMQGSREGSAQIVGHEFSVGPLSQVKSTNWAGYVDRGHTFSYVEASWRVPRVSCTSADSVVSFWVGMDGYHSHNVQQAGTLAYCHESKVTYYTWWEMYPTNDAQLVGSTVRPGDAITASVAVSGHSYTLKVTDSTTAGNSFSRKATCASCRNASIDWIAERPSGDGGLFPLARFGHLLFDDAKAGVGSGRGSISTYANDAITMINRNGQALAQVSPLRQGGSRFVATWLRPQ